MYVEFSNLNTQYNKLFLTYSNHSAIAIEFSNYDKIVKYTQNLIKSKIENIKLHDKARLFKRGLINGIGSVIKGLTGNLDSSDGEKIYKILNHLQTNENNLNSQLSRQYSINNQLMQNFNSTLQDIQHNELILKSKIIQLNQIIKEGITHQDIIFGKDLFNQLIIMYNAVLNILQDIENSISFCRLGTLHPSIINSHDLFLELKNIEIHYKNTLPFQVKYENILNFEAVLKINCKIESDKVIYFLSLPINYETNFDLFFMLPLPTKVESKLLTIIPISKYLLKSKNDNFVRPLFDKCTFGKPWHCPSRLQANHKSHCEENILLYQNASQCQYVQLEITENHLEIIPEINQYLAVFPTEEKIVIQCDKHTETKSLFGTFLIKKNDCKVQFRNQEIIFQESSFGKPMVIDVTELKINNNNAPALKIELKKLNLKEIEMHPMLPIYENPIEYHIPSIWTGFLYIGLIIGIAYVYKTLRNKKLRRNSATEMDKNISLPGDASF